MDLHSIYAEHDENQMEGEEAKEWRDKEHILGEVEAHLWLFKLTYRIQPPRRPTGLRKGRPCQPHQSGDTKVAVLLGSQYEGLLLDGELSWTRPKRA